MNLVPIGDYVEKVRSWNPVREAACETITYVDLGSIDNDHKVIGETQSVLGSEAPSRARQLLADGDILVSTVRPYLNGVAKVPSHLDGATGSTGFCVLRPTKAKIDQSYLFHWVKASTFINDMVRKSTGASYPAVSDRIIHESLIPLPPLPEQRRIAAILDQADVLRRLRRQSLSRLSDLGQAIFQKMFREEDRFVELQQIIKVSSGDGLTAKAQNGGQFPVFGGNGINGWHDQPNVAADTIIIGRVGVYCGAIHVTDRPSWVTDNALIVKLKSDINMIYLVNALKNANLNQYANISSQPLISGARIYPVRIPLPSDQKQRRYAELERALALQADIHGEGVRTIDSLFASLQHRAFRGEL